MPGPLKVLLAAMLFTLPAAVAGSAPEIGRHTTPAGHEFWYVPIEDAKRTAVLVTRKAGMPSSPDAHEAPPASVYR